MSQYRDPLAGLVSQVATKRAALEDRARRLAPVARAMLPERLLRAMEELHPRVLDAPADLAGLSAQDAALEALLSAYDEALALAPALCALPDDVRDPPRPSLPPPWLLEEGWLLRFKTAVAERVKEVTDGEGWLARWGDYGYVSRFRLNGAPIIVQTTADLSTDGATIGSFVSMFRTSVPARVPHLEVRRERAYHSVGRAMHLASELSVGDEVFDRMFWIVGAEATTSLLVPEARRLLLGLGTSRPALVVGDGILDLVVAAPWRDVGEDALPDAAISVLLAVRAAIDSGT